MRYAMTVLMKLFCSVTSRLGPSAEVAERAFERAAEQFHAH